MTAKRFTTVCTLLATLILASLSLHARTGSKDFGDYTVLWSVLPSTFLAPEVARANNLQRSKGIGIVNISIMKENGNGGMTPVTGQVEGRVSNDVQQVNFLAFRRIQEGESVYFIAEYQYSSGELMTFNITARPTGYQEDLAVRFAHTLFSD
ncbi:MAG: DUF4426 domain-containing protein [Pseudomonadota bacterium]|nr:DUF4426 domain-containing protein [Pseudomonadota bacterium]